MKPALRSATLITARVAVLAGIVAGSYCTWDTQPSQGLGDGFVRGNGRIEATEMDVATRQRGRVQHIFAREQVTTGQLGVVWVKVDPHAEWPPLQSVSPELIVRARS
jgi:hypothetical protein